MLCAKAGCRAAGTHRPKARVWAAGYPRDSHDPLEMWIGLPCCERHAREFPIGEGLRSLLKELLAADGRAPPDLDTMEVVAVPLAQLPPGLH